MSKAAPAGLAPSSLQVPTLQALESASRGASMAVAGLHPKLRTQLAELGDAPTLAQLLPLISEYYSQFDGERRAVVRSMQLLADEARSFAHGIAGDNADQLQAILDHTTDSILTVTGDGSISRCNRTAELQLGYVQPELVGLPLRTLLPELASHASMRAALQALAEHAADGKPGPHACQARHKDGTLIAVEVTARQVRIDRREVHVICLRDTTERQRVEQALRDSEARYRTLVESAPEVIVVLDYHTGRCTDANENAQRFFAVSPGQIATLVLQDLVEASQGPVQADGTTAEETLLSRALLAEPRVFEWEYRSPSGALVSTEVRLMPLPGSANLMRASITDISARKRAETIRACERAVFERIAANAPLTEVLEAIITLVETISGSSMGAVCMLAADGRHFQSVVAPRLPARLRAVEERTTIDIRNGAAAAVVYLGRHVLVADVAKDPYWQRRRELARECGIAGSWAMPINASGGRVLGALVLYRTETGSPLARDLDLLQHTARLAGIAIERRQADEALRDSEAKFRGLYESVLEGVYQCTREGQVRAVNPAFVKMLGYNSAEEIYALPGVAMLYASPAARVSFERQLAAEGEVHNAEHILRRQDGQQVVVLESARVLRDEQQRVVAFEGTVADITARKRAEQAVFDEKERAQVTLQSIGDAVITTDASGRIDYMNPVAEQLSGWQSADGCGLMIDRVLRLRDESSRDEIESPLLRCLRDGQVINFAEQSVLLNRQDQEIAIQDSAAPIRDRAGKVIGAVVVFRDVTKERRLKRALSYQASHDALTGLINRRELDHRLEQAVQSARDGGQTHVLLYVDLDQFKVVNDTCGHTAGDRLLRDVTALLMRHVRSADTIARLGGDEFGILMQSCTLEQATRVADAIRQAVRDYRFNWEDNSTSVGASIGVVEITSDCEGVASVLSAADIACYAAKEAGRNRVHVYSSGEVSGRHREMYWVSRVTRAVDEQRLVLYQQTIVPTGSAPRSIPPMRELLVRLQGDDGSLVLPGEFIPAAERYNLVSAIDRWVVMRAVELLREHASAEDPTPFIYTVNISGTSLSERGFLEHVLMLVEEPQIAAGLCFEITETAVITNLNQAVYFMKELRRRGCRFALDDFGSGLSSFHYLKTLPVDFLKIDGQFVANVATDPVDRSMVEAICKVAGALGIATIAEKVESQQVLDELARLGVDYAQGYHIGRPAPLEPAAAKANG